MRPPARARHGARAPDSRAEEPGELFDDREPLLRTNTASTADDDLSLGEGNASVARLNVLGDSDGHRGRVKLRPDGVDVDADRLGSLLHRARWRRRPGE